jgi:HAD superfamily hydrolase (TIGR01509 family)
MYGILFDMDGVLVDSARAHWESWKRLAAEIGQPMTEQQFLDTFGRNNRDIIPLLFGHNDGPTVQRLSDRKESLYRDLIRDGVPTIDGAVDLVRSCHEAEFGLAIGSSGPRVNVELVLSLLGIDRCFQAVITGEQVSRGKPDPQVFQLAAAGLGLPTNRCAVIEDAPSGIEAAVAAGATAIALTGTHPAAALGAAHYVVASLRAVSPRQLREWIDRVAGRQESA